MGTDFPGVVAFQTDRQISARDIILTEVITVFKQGNRQSEFLRMVSDRDLFTFSS